MDKWFNKATTLAMCGALLMAACGDDEKSTPTAAEPDAAAELTPEAVLLTGTLVASFQTAFFASLVADTTSLPGVTGSVEIMGNNWVLQDFSPDGMLVLSGALTVGKDLFPNIPVAGTINFSGVQEGTMVLDMLVSVAGADLSTTGTITIDGTEFDVGELVAAAEAAQAAAAAAGG